MVSEICAITFPKFYLIKSCRTAFKLSGIYTLMGLTQHLLFTCLIDVKSRVIQSHILLLIVNHIIFMGYFHVELWKNTFCLFPRTKRKIIYFLCNIQSVLGTTFRYIIQHSFSWPFSRDFTLNLGAYTQKELIQSNNLDNFYMSELFEMSKNGYSAYAVIEIERRVYIQVVAARI